MTDTEKRQPLLPPGVVAAIRARRPFEDHALIGYVSEGGTYIVASSGLWTDDGQPRDLLAVLAGDLGHGRIVPLYIGTNPATVEFLEQKLASRSRT